MAEGATIRFGRYVLHPQQGLRNGPDEVRVTAKSLAVLHALACRAGKIVTKSELFTLVWPDTAVSDAALTSCIKEVRQALRDDAREPQYIETVHRRGYRFIGLASPAAAASPDMPSAALSPPMVGRAALLQDLHATLQKATTGERQFLFITGEAGVGKTTLVERFVSEVAAGGTVRVGVGRSIEHHGHGEPYQPILEALTRLARDPDDLVAALSRYAPSWLAQLPALAPAPSVIPASAAGAERMMRELADAIEAFTAHVPLVLWLEDVHWADSSTIEWLAAAARRREPARLLVVATSRPVNGAEPNPTLGAVIDALRVKALGREVVLEGLEPPAVHEYVTLRYPPDPERANDFDAAARLVHAQTRGNPLFVGHVLRDLHARGWLEQQPHGWRVRTPIDARDLGVPEDLRRLIERDIERLREHERDLLEVAAVAGATFSAAAVAAAANVTVEDAETTLGALARRRHFVGESGVSEWPDGTVAAKFDFVHALHREVLYQRLPAGRRAGLHRCIGAILEAGYGQHASELAAELAMHFDRGHDHVRAIVHLQAAAEVARRRGATREAQMHLERALAILDREPAGVTRDEHEIALRIKFGSLLQVSRGFGAAEVESAFARARALCEQIGDQPRLFPALWGLWLFYWGRGRLSSAIDLAAHLQALARQTNDLELRLQAHHACWVTSFSRGHLVEAHDYATQGLALYDTVLHAPTAAYYGNHDAAVCAAAFSARATALMGQLQAALRITEWAVSHARALMHPVTVCHSLTFAAWVHHLRQNAAASSECAEAALALAREHDLNLFGAWAAVSAGWADVQQGQHEMGLRRLRDAIANVRAIGSEQFLSHMLGVFAEACLSAGAHEEGRGVLQEALSYVDSSGERFYEAELHRTKGELLLASNPRDAIRAEAESAFQLARTVAHNQGAALLELRATISLARSWLETGREADAREMMLSAHTLAPEAHTLPDVRAAFMLIECSR